MLASDPRTALAGLEMASRCDGELPPDEIALALAKIPTEQAQRMLPDLAANGSHGKDLVEQLAETGPAGIRQLAWEYLFRTDGAAAERGRALLADPDEGVSCVAAAALLAKDPADKLAFEKLKGS